MTIVVRPASIRDLPALESVERLAAQRFPTEVLPADMANRTVPLARLQAAQSANQLWVATAGSPEVVGFLLAEQLDEDLHVAEMSVLPSHGRQGIGSALLRVAFEHAREVGYQRLTLTTFSTLPWNAPFYAKHGLREMTAADIGAALGVRLEQEKMLGLAHRVAMCRRCA